MKRTAGFLCDESSNALLLKALNTYIHLAPKLSLTA